MADLQNLIWYNHTYAFVSYVKSWIYYLGFCFGSISKSRNAVKAVGIDYSTPCRGRVKDWLSSYESTFAQVRPCPFWLLTIKKHARESYVDQTEIKWWFSGNFVASVSCRIRPSTVVWHLSAGIYLWEATLRCYKHTINNHVVHSFTAITLCITSPYLRCVQLRRKHFVNNFIVNTGCA